MLPRIYTRFFNREGTNQEPEVHLPHMGPPAIDPVLALILHVQVQLVH